MNEVDVIEQLIKELLEKGYPEASLRREFTLTIGRSARAYIDLAVIDPDTNDVLAIFEVKTSKNPKAFERGADQLRAYSKQFSQSTLSFIYVYDGDTKKIGIVEQDSSEIKIVSSLPIFSSLQSGNKAQHKIEIKESSTQVKDRFTLTCYVLSLLVAVILIMDIFKFYQFTTQQLSLLGIMIGLLVIPYAAKFKLLGMEFERHTEKKGKGT